MMTLFTKISFLLYILATLFYFTQIIFQKKMLSKLGQRLVLLSFLIQSVAFVIYIYRVGYPFLLQSADSYLFSAWVMAALFLLVSVRYHFELFGAFILPVILILYLLAHFATENYFEVTPLMFSPWASVHIVFGFLSFSIFLLSFVMGLIFLLQEFQLKRKKLWAVFDRLPSLDVLDQLHYKALTVGFVLLTLVIITGLAWAKSVKGVYFFDDPRQLWSIIAWLTYGFFFQARFTAGWRGRRGILLSLIGFQAILFTFLEVRHL